MRKYVLLNKILIKYFDFLDIPNIYICGISINSNLIKKDFLFVALKGYKSNGRKYIYNAVLNGAVSVLTYSNLSKNYCLYNLKYNIFIFYILNLDYYLSEISGEFYDNPSKKIKLIGVTGTNGKTTVVNFISYWLYLLGYKSTLLSTIGNGFYNDLYPTLNTTISSVDIQNNLNNFYLKGSKFTSMEVSSHSLIQNRVKSLFFSSVIFTNLTLDHLDYHKNIKNYELAKYKLFTEFNVKNLIINIDDNIGFKWFNNLPKKFIIAVTFYKKNILYFNNCRWIYIKKIYCYGFLKKIYFDSFWGNDVLNVFFIGNFNIINFILSFVTLLSLNIKLKYLLDTSKYLILPEGRMEIFNIYKKPLCIVDYAHTPDALKNILLESRKYCKGKLWCIFGCTGNRDKSKRSLMGFIAKKYSDILVITNDDLYDENEFSILNDIKSGIYDFKNVYIILNRILAIKFCIKNSNYNDLILIAGKGHENFQILKNNKRVCYSDRKLVSKLLGKYTWDFF